MLTNYTKAKAIKAIIILVKGTMSEKDENQLFEQASCSSLAPMLICSTGTSTQVAVMTHL